jgi:hypothetical protein
VAASRMNSPVVSEGASGVESDVARAWGGFG